MPFATHAKPNDMSEVNIDAALVDAMAAPRSRGPRRPLVEMSNGCICCTLRDDLLAEVSRLAQRGALRLPAHRVHRHLRADAVALATFTFEDEQGVSLSDVARLDTMVTVVDAVKPAPSDLFQPRLPARPG